MKWLFFILSLYIVLLPALPCRDNTEHCARESAAMQQHDQHDDHEDEQEGCSPFCACACCQVSGNNTQLSIFITVQPLSTAIHYSWPLSAGSTSDRSGNIWQPPRLDLIA